MPENTNKSHCQTGAKLNFSLFPKVNASEEEHCSEGFSVKTYYCEQKICISHLDSKGHLQIKTF
jgi:hypothetical protein